MIKAVMFDFDQTLVDSADGFRAAEKQVQKKIFDNLALKSWDEFISKYRGVRKKFYERSNFSRKSMWEELYWYYCRQCETKLLEKWESQYWAAVKAETNIFPEANKVLDTLAVDYKLAVITNTEGQSNSSKHRINDFEELENFFETVIVAGESEVPAKPDAAAFGLCLEKLGLTGDEAVYVGDDWRIDICGARDAGVQPIWIKHHLVKRNFPEIEDTVPQITSLNELLDLENFLPSQ